MLRRFTDFDVSVTTKSADFLRPPRKQQRTWLLRRAIDEFAHDLSHLDGLSASLIGGSERRGIGVDDWNRTQADYDASVLEEASELSIDGQQVMQDWERPLMRALAKDAAAAHGHVLEVGFGMGISATYLQEFGVASHTVIEANSDVREKFARWRAGYPDHDIRLVEGYWQDVLGDLGQFDAILFDTYPTSKQEWFSNVVNDVTYAAHFFPAAAEHLRPGGVFAYYTEEIDSLGRGHQRRLLEHFSSFRAGVVRGLKPPDDCNYWWAESMVTVAATK
jgi:guanidinoacetate N-methyltransferase